MATASSSVERRASRPSSPAIKAIARKNSTNGVVPGRFGVYGGRYVPETLMAALDELEREYEKAKRDRKFQQRLDLLLKTYAGRPTPLFFARRLTEKLGGAKIYLKREDLLHTGAHKINNCLGQGLLVERMGKRRVIAETGAGQHGVATATVCALLGFECVVYMGTEDMRRQELNVFRMRLLGAEVRGVDSGSRTLKDAINEAMRDWVTNVRTTHYLLGSVLGAHPYPTMVRDFQRVIGREARAQILKAEGKLPTAIIACVGGGSNSIGIFYDFLKDKKVQLIGVEAGGRGEALGQTRRPLPRRLARRFAGNVFLRTAGCGGPDRAHALRLRRTGLSVHRPRARHAQRYGPRRIRPRLRRRSSRGNRAARAHRRNYSRARIRARRRRSH